MNDSEQTPEVQPPLQRVPVITASIACFASLIFFYWVARPAVELLEVRSNRIVGLFNRSNIGDLYHSLSQFWHRKITGAARTCSLLLLSAIILGGELIATGIIFCMATFCLNAMQGGNH